MSDARESGEPLAQAAVHAPRPRPLALELALVVLVSLAVFIPGISTYSLVDPWETHYGEVARMMKQSHDWVHTDWPGGMDPKDHEGFRSKPVLSFWLMAASMTVFDVGDDGGYSGEMTDSTIVMIAIRLPFILCAVLGLTLLWWMLARLVSRRMAWLALLVVGSTPFFAMVARQAIPDMPHLACLIAAISMFAMALEDGDRPAGTAFTLRLGRRRIDVSHLHVFLAIVGGFLLIQCVYYVMFFVASPRLAVRRFPNPVLFFPLFMGFLFVGLNSRWGWMVVRFISVILGSAIALAASPKKHALERFDDWDRYAPDRYIIRGLSFPVVWLLGGGWQQTNDVADRLLGMRPLTTMRQIFLLWMYTFLGVSILAKGPPALAVFCLVAAFYVILFNRWRDLFEGHFEIKRGILLMLVIFVPWHVGMYLKEGVRFIDEYVFTHVLNRAAVGVDNSPGTFARISSNGGYTSVIGHGMLLWAALIPPALAASLLRARTETRESRVRMLMTLWAICATAMFLLVQTKFHHYILPAVPALGVLVAFFLDDIVTGKDRLHPVYAALGIGIILLLTRDLMWEPDRWIEMFVFRYDRPWPSSDPYFIDPSDGFFMLGIIGAIAIAIAALPWRRIGVAALCVAGLAGVIWALQCYMPDAGKHWGMREAVRSYYEQRTIYGHKNVYFSAHQVYDDWHANHGKWRFDTMIPDTLHIGQPMMIRVQVNKPDKQEVVEHEMGMIGTVTGIGDHTVEVTISPAERAKIQALVDAGKKAKRRAVRPPIRVVDADRILAWQLYWRGENFWTADELFGPVPEMRTGFNKVDNADFLKYLGDRSKAPLGRRYFIITEAGRAMSVRGLLPTTRAKESFEVVNTTSNKFTLVSFFL